ncbi:electron transport complex subunit RsxC [Aliidiomarina halalkaliphila]|uniref:Ion-translocating oxidoreductase complex subunit C n=1 Tax=Aliidiomarina halalkaliphila TaxID=2593535 RepID=A0A552X516_9GAMM|nr:electron transport complex subunit RsxC [Aliidiomarina halalkaliphila]TRW50085.1 electron transport complex subunit RsxC [Aliidiomarina halalkaliphila]
MSQVQKYNGQDADIQLWTFPGGIHPPERKAPANQEPIRRFPLADEFIIPLRQHIGALSEVQVSVGDHVRKGDLLSAPGIEHGLPVHAPTSGEIIEIGEFPLNHPSGLSGPGIRLRSDHEDTWGQRHPLPDYRNQSHLTVLEHLQRMGIAGLGGAGFPTARKVAGARGIDCLIINGAECEPYIAADDRLMREHAAEIVRGSLILQWMTHASSILIAIEDNKPEAIAAMREAVAQTREQLSAEQQSDFVLKVVVIPTKYPSGGERQLIQILTGKQVPAHGLPADIGILMHNTGTAWAICRAIEHGEPLLERVVTLTGESIGSPCTAWVPLGTPVQHVLAHVDFTPEAQQRVIIGGPMMGFTLPHLQVPVIKTTNCILAPTRKELPPAGQEMPCIRCGACADVCPASLLPQQLYWLANAQDYDGLKAHHLADCIECGACAYVCPSEIPLVQYYRQAKAEMREQAIEHHKAEIARQRFEARQARLEREKEERLERHAQAAKAREEALAARKQQAEQRSASGTTDDAMPDANSDPVASAVARAKARKAEREAARNEESSAVTGTDTVQAQDPKKAAVAAAVARAKARKEAQAAAQKDTETNTEASTPEDKKKAAVAAAVARAKARKAAKQKDEDS